MKTIPQRGTLRALSTGRDRGGIRPAASTSGSGQSRIASSTSAILKFATPMWRVLPSRFAFASAPIVSRERNVVDGRPVHVQHVDVIDLEVREALVDRAREIVGAQVLVRDLGHEENVFARDAGSADAFADAFFRAVFPRRVDVAITELERFAMTSVQSPSWEVPKPMAGIFAPFFAERMGIELMAHVLLFVRVTQE